MSRLVISRSLLYYLILLFLRGEVLYLRYIIARSISNATLITKLERLRRLILIR